MMQETKENRTRWLKVRLKPSEYEQIEKRTQRTTFQTMSEFARAMLTGKPVRVLTRDQSMDEILEELILLRKELNGIGQNLNQAVKRIHSASDQADARLWMGLLTVINGNLSPAIGQIKERMNQYADLWLQKSKAEKA